MTAGDPPRIVPILPDPVRDARRAAYRAKERARVSRAFDRYLADTYGDAFDERYGTQLHHKGNYAVPKDEGDS
jgi:hypothetical protein